MKLAESAIENIKTYHGTRDPAYVYALSEKAIALNGLKRFEEALEVFFF
ncbi:hypothetical protein [Salinimicrobium soli]